uniref:Uncharacterized protein n=1 Tax=Streptomyces sp. NBC_00093 TaxID=2975649 RepID=A0AAU2A2D3_9ACTN
MLPQSEYYQITLHSNGSGGEFDVAFNIARAGSFAGDGSDMGNGSVPGMDQLMAIAEGIASGLEAASAPYWDNITVVSITRTPPQDAVTLYP